MRAELGVPSGVPLCAGAGDSSPETLSCPVDSLKERFERSKSIVQRVSDPGSGVAHPMFFPAGRLLARFACHGAVHGHCRNAKGAVQAPPPAPAPPSARHGLCTAAAAISERRPTARPREFIGRSCRTSTRERRSGLEGSSGRLMAVGIPGLDPVSPGGLRAASVPLATGRISPLGQAALPRARPASRPGMSPSSDSLSSRFSQPPRKPSGVATVTATNHTVFDYFRHPSQLLLTIGARRFLHPRDHQ